MFSLDSIHFHRNFMKPYNNFSKIPFLQDSQLFFKNSNARFLQVSYLWGHNKKAIRFPSLSKLCHAWQTGQVFATVMLPNKTTLKTIVCLWVIWFPGLQAVNGHHIFSLLKVSEWWSNGCIRQVLLVLYGGSPGELVELAMPCKASAWNGILLLLSHSFHWSESSASLVRDIAWSYIQEGEWFCSSNRMKGWKKWQTYIGLILGF